MSDLSEDYGDENDVEAMLQPFRDAFNSLNAEVIDKDTLKDIFETMGQVIIEDEFEQQFRDIDTDGVSS